MTRLLVWLAGWLISLVGGYQRHISPRLRPVCRFYPSCSEYARRNLYLYGPFRGGWRAVCRLACCHPLHPGGRDPV